MKKFEKTKKLKAAIQKAEFKLKTLDSNRKSKVV
jgi:hypothetical protein